MPLRRLVSSGSPLEPAIGFSRAVRVDRHVFVAATAAIWPDGSVKPGAGPQARRSLQIIEQALLESGASLQDVVRTRVFLVDRGDADAVAEVHGNVFGAIRPASGFIVVSGFVDPRWRVEIEADAIVGSARPSEPRERPISFRVSGERGELPAVQLNIDRARRDTPGAEE